MVKEGVNLVGVYVYVKVSGYDLELVGVVYVDSS